MAEEYPDPPTEPEQVAPADLNDRIEAGEPVRLLDVRDRDEFEAWHVSGPTVTATQIPHAKFLQAQVRGTVDDLAAEVDGEGPITVVCGRGEASAHVAGLLSEAGIEAHNLAGGMRGWARVYEAHQIPGAGETGGDWDGATVYQYRRPASGCLSYLVVSAGEAAVVDPLRVFADRYVEDAADHDATLRYAVDTHVHADHVSGVRRLGGGETTRVVPEGATDRGLAFDAATVADGDELRIGDVALRAVALPGHTTEMTGFAIGDLLATGDSLFLESVARPDLEPDGGPEVGVDATVTELARDLYRTLTDRLADWPDHTTVAPGHYGARATTAPDGTYTALLGDLRERLRAFGMDSDSFVEDVRTDLPPRPANYERIVALNLGRETADDADAFELELGPNNCAVAE